MKKSVVHFLSLVVPVFRQEKTIVKDLRNIKKALDKIRYDYEIIAVIDGKVDRSFERIKKAKIKKLKHFFYKIKPFRVRHNGMLISVIQIANRCESWLLAIAYLLPQTPFYILG